MPTCTQGAVTQRYWRAAGCRQGPEVPLNSLSRSDTAFPGSKRACGGQAQREGLSLLGAEDTHPTQGLGCSAPHEP